MSRGYSWAVRIEILMHAILICPQRAVVLILKCTVCHRMFVTDRITQCIFRRVHKIARSDSYLLMSARPSTWKNSAITGRIFMKFGIPVFFENLSKIKPKLHSYLIRITGNLHEDQYTFLIITSSLFLRMRNVSDKRCRENQNSHFMFKNFCSKNRAVCEILLKYSQKVTDDNMVYVHSVLDT
jgi:hypothetical protein